MKVSYLTLTPPTNISLGSHDDIFGLHPSEELGQQCCPPPLDSSQQTLVFVSAVSWQPPPVGGNSLDFPGSALHHFTLSSCFLRPRPCSLSAFPPRESISCSCGESQCVSRLGRNLKKLTSYLNRSRTSEGLMWVQRELVVMQPPRPVCRYKYGCRVSTPSHCANIKPRSAGYGRACSAAPGSGCGFQGPAPGAAAAGVPACFQMFAFTRWLFRKRPGLI